MVGMYRRGLSRLVAIGLFSMLLCQSAAYGNSAQSSIDLGLSFFQQDTTGLIAQTGYFIHFQFEMKETWIRPTFGSLIEFSSGSNRLLNGHMQGGFELVALRANYIKPFLGVNGEVVWVNFD